MFQVDCLVYLVTLVKLQCALEGSDHGNHGAHPTTASPGAAGVACIPHFAEGADLKLFPIFHIYSLTCFGSFAKL